MVIDSAELWRRRLENLLWAGLLLGALTALAGLLGYLMAGWVGVLWTTLLAVGAALAMARMPAQVVLRQAGAVPLAYPQAPQLYDILGVLARRAGLDTLPTLHYVPEARLNAFAVGDRRQGGIAVTGGLLQLLGLRETAAVLAHELSHLRHGDTRVLALAAMLTQAVVYLALLAQLAVLVSLPWLLSAEGPSVGLLPLLLIVFAPTAAILLQLALSRAREYAADLEAVALTGDPESLGRALRLLQARNSVWLASIFGRRSSQDLPPWLSTHPPIEERLRRLGQLQRPGHPPVVERGPYRKAAGEGLDPALRIRRR